MEYRTELRPDGLYCFLSGDFDMGAADEVRLALLRELGKSHARRLIFDCAELDFIDSSGLGVILGRYRELVACGGRVEIRAARDGVYQVLELSGLTRIMRVERRVTDDGQSFKAGI